MAVLVDMLCSFQWKRVLTDFKEYVTKSNEETFLRLLYP